MSKTEKAIAFAEGYHDLVRRDVFHLVPVSRGVLLDVGGGIGATSAALKADGKCGRAIVVDLVDQDSLPGVDARFSGDLNDQALIDQIHDTEGLVDTILCLDVLEHLVDPWGVLGRLTQLLAPGGAIIISLPNARNALLVKRLVFQGTFKLDDRGIMDRTHLRWFARADAIALATSSGLELEKIEGKIAGRRRKVLNALTFGIFRGFFDLQYLIRVRKV
ncbi:MAG: methyltransferase domain-containing protein [Rhodobacteraceae bacterium]|nr:methyltransferase domain-containing protein [Paracoccaceae bacterium]